MATKKTAWGEIFSTRDPNVDPYASRKDGLIYLGREFDGGGGDAGAQIIGSQFAKVDPYLQGASSQGQFSQIKDTLSGRLSEMMGINVDAYEQLNSLYTQIGQVSGASAGFSFHPGSSDSDTADSNRQMLERGLAQQAAGRAKYDQLVTQFNQQYEGAKTAKATQDQQYNQRLAELDAQRAASEAAARRNQAWASNLNQQNRQNENLPDTVTAGTASGGEGGGADGDVGGKPKRRRGSLSSNLGLNA